MTTLPPSTTFADESEIDRLYGAITPLAGIVVELEEELDEEVDVL
jgi:hypothetical protein